MKQTMKDLVFTLEWTVAIEENMSLNLDEVMDKMREAGGCELIDVTVRNTEKSK